ncbi:aspartic peptidase domain-containing protein, partial [Phakopsora pachyrhizi]
GKGVKTSVNVESVVGYYLAKLTIGENNYDLVIDTGSALTWIGNKKKFVPSRSTRVTGTTFNCEFGAGYAEGNIVVETVTIGDKTFRQIIGVAKSSQSLPETDGMLGLGPTNLTLVITSKKDKAVPTIVDNLFTSQSYSFAFATTNEVKALNGRMTLGGVDSTLFKGSLTWIPKTKLFFGSYFYGVEASIYCGKKLIAKNSGGIMDSGTTLLLLHDDLFKSYMKEIPGASIETGESESAGLFKIREDMVHSIPPLYIHFGDFNAILTAEQQLFPSVGAAKIGGRKGYRYGIINTMKLQSVDEGAAFIIGMKFLEHYYTAYDGMNQRVGIATST